MERRWINNFMCTKRNNVNTIEGIIDASSFIIANSHPSIAMFLELVKPVAKDVCSRLISDRENYRISFVTKTSIEKICKNLNNRVYRSADYFEPRPGLQPEAYEIFEGVLLKAKGEFYEKKLPFYSSFYANLAFEETISYEESNILLQYLNVLTYRQIVILDYIFQNTMIDMNGWEARFQDIPYLDNYYDFYMECKELWNYNLIRQNNDHGGYSLGMTKMKLSKCGIDFIRLIDIDQIPNNEFDKVRFLYETVKSIIRNNTHK